MEATMFVTWISPENMWDPDLWMRVLFLSRKRELASGVTPELFFMPVLLMIIVSLRSSLVEEVI